jgi:dihydrofolate reductase
MRPLHVFNSVTLDGYFTGENGDLRWAHGNQDDPEFGEFVSGNASGGGVLLMGRVTYDMMVRYWPTPQAMQNDPVVARGMNEMQKFVFSRTLDNATWSNTTILKGDVAEEVRKLKEGDGPGITILGSGTIVAQLAETDLIDQYQFVVVPVFLGKGRTMFEGVKAPHTLKLTDSRSFKNGSVVLTYEA